MPRPWSLILCVLALTVLARPGFGQAADLKPLLAGASAPLTINLGALNGDWHRLSVGLPADSSSMMGLYAALLTGGTGDVYYTKGELITVGADEFLVAYHVPSPKLDFQALQRGGGQPPKPVKLTAATSLSLALLNLHTVSSLSEIRPFDLTQEIAESGSPGPLAGPVEAQDSSAQSTTHLKQLGLALLQYAQDNDETLPPMTDAATVKKAIFPYVKNDDIFLNPISHQPYLPNTSLSHRKFADISDPAGLVVYYEATPAPDNTRAMLFIDGHVKRFPEAQWPRLKAASHIPNTPTPSELPPGGP